MAIFKMKSNLIKNTTTNYITVFVRVLQAVFVTRWTVSYLGPDYYGLWALLWSFFSYALLLDFGFGISAQKYTSAEIFNKDISRYNRIISTVFSFHVAMLVLIALGTVCVSFFLGDIIRVHDAEKLAYCRKAFLIFGIGTAFVFPLGMFSEILVGLQKLYLRNYVNTLSKIVEIIGVGLIFFLGGGLMSLVIFTMVATFSTNIIIAFIASKSIKGFKLHYKIDWETCKEIAGFSGFVYIMSVSRLVLNKSTRLLISIFCGLESVGLYHLASRLSEFCFMGASQYQENVRPMVSNLHARGEFEKLSKMVLGSMVWNSFIALLIMLPSFIFSGQIIEVLFKVSTPEVTYMSRLFIVSMFCSVACRRIPEVYLQMTERHKRTGYVTMAEALSNLVLNIIMLPRFGVAIVLWNSILIRLFYTYIFIVPCMLRSLKINMFVYVLKVYIVPALICLPAIAVAYGVNLFDKELGSFFTMFLGGGACAFVFMFFAYFFMLEEQGKIYFREKFGELIVKLTKFSRA